MLIDMTPSIDLDSAIAAFRAGSSASGEGLHLQNWSDDDWRDLLRFTTVRAVAAGNAVIRRGEPDRMLYFLLRGDLEVVARSIDGMSLEPLARISEGSVLGEQSFFDGKPRSASVWAVDDCEVAAMTPEQYSAFEAARPALARDLLFALGRILATRLRRTTARSHRIGDRLL
jgi:CRP/FNR family transcriptional regulator, cyclic AMP receptor protein